MIKDSKKGYRLSSKEKEANDKQWYKDNIRSLNKVAFNQGSQV